MKTTNTTAIGDSFESLSLKIIKRVVEDDQLGYLGNCLKFIPKAKYRSSRRQKDVIFDLANRRLASWGNAICLYLPDRMQKL